MARIGLLGAIVIIIIVVAFLAFRPAPVVSKERNRTFASRTVDTRMNSCVSHSEPRLSGL
jgi:hypothetical protein